jgi:hypothetical protein
MAGKQTTLSRLNSQNSPSFYFQGPPNDDQKHRTHRVRCALQLFHPARSHVPAHLPSAERFAKVRSAAHQLAHQNATNDRGRTLLHILPGNHPHRSVPASNCLVVLELVRLLHAALCHPRNGAAAQQLPGRHGHQHGEVEVAVLFPHR